MRKSAENSSSETLSNLGCNNETINQSTSSSDEAYTPVHKMNQSNKGSVNPHQWDPRSPTEGIVRTPIQLNQETVTILDDPRSPSCGINRTPIVQTDCGDSKAILPTQKLNNSQSTVEINQTPISISSGPGMFYSLNILICRLFLKYTILWYHNQCSTNV